ncbi:unnamed protein product [Meganyctiphanes norvegica]|uniref:Uncharacterized protein n=1 Tax=Meganyctiphanes norvegica TaxID=48144 RepID=A0AAV2RHI9_MEGNR
MAYTKVLTPSLSPLSDLLGPLPTDDDCMPVVEDPTEARTRTSILGRLEEQVRAASNEQYTLVVPPTLLDQVADDVLRLAQDEPCGLRGCFLTVRLADVTSSTESETYTRLAQVKADQFTPTTHELLLTLRPDPASWFTKMARIFRSLSKRRMVVSPQFELIKQRLYNFED